MKDYLKSMKGKKVHAIYSPDDPMPALMFFLMLPYLVLKRG
jgi:predicted ATP-grasp superfamily ATP-dependent carboligase